MKARWMLPLWCIVLAAQPASAQTPAPATGLFGYNWLTVPFVISTLIAVAAFIRPDVTRVIRRMRTRLELFEIRRVEVGFGNLGSTLGIAGTLRGVPNDQFVRSIALTLVRTRDNLTHSFNWAALRPIGLLPAEPKDLRAAMGFKLAAGDAMPLNVLLVDEETREHVEAQLLRLRDAWIIYTKDNKAIEGQLDPRQEWQNFSNGQATPIPAQVHAEITKAFYFAAGDYQVELAIDTWDPEITFRFAYAFALSREHEDQLRLGIIGGMMTACSHQDGRAAFVNPALTRVH